MIDNNCVYDGAMKEHLFLLYIIPFLILFVS